MEDLAKEPLINSNTEKINNSNRYNEHVKILGNEKYSLIYESWENFSFNTNHNRVFNGYNLLMTIILIIFIIIFIFTSGQFIQYLTNFNFYNIPTTQEIKNDIKVENLSNQTESSDIDYLTAKEELIWDPEYNEDEIYFDGELEEMDDDIDSESDVNYLEEDLELEYLLNESDTEPMSLQMVTVDYPNDTQAYRLPISNGYTDERVIESITEILDVPVTIEAISTEVSSISDYINGLWSISIFSTNRNRPHLNHGRVIYYRHTGKDDIPLLYLYYFHKNHSWIISDSIDINKPTQIYYTLPFGCMLPIWENENMSKDLKNSNLHNTMGINWLKNNKNKVEPSDLAFFAYNGDTISVKYIQLVYYKEEEEEDLDELYEEIDSYQELYKSFNEGESDPELDGIIKEKLRLQKSETIPENLRTLQHYFIHPIIPIYHTLDQICDDYNHEYMLDYPEDFLMKYPHPDIQGIEVIVKNKNPLKHPIRHSVEKYNESDPYDELDEDDDDEIMEDEGDDELWNFENVEDLYGGYDLDNLDKEELELLENGSSNINEILNFDEF